MIQSSYDFIAPGKIVFGWQRRYEITEHVRRLGDRVHVICGSRTINEGGELAKLADLLKADNLPLVDIEMQTHEPTVEDVDRLTRKYLAAGVRISNGDMFIALGGGSAIDVTKAVCAMIPNFTEKHGSVRDFLEGVGCGAKIVNDPIPMIAVPTTAGTGAEATKNAVIASYDPPFKKSLRDDRLMPRMAIIDPELTLSNPPFITASSGMDTITQLIESFISRKSRPIPQSLAVQGLRLAFFALPKAYSESGNREAREKMAHAALLSGICLANAGLGMVHGISPALGTHGRVPHGEACAILLPRAMRVNAEVSWKRFVLLATVLFPNTYFANEEEAVETLFYEVSMLCNTLNIPRRLSEVGIRETQLPAIVADCRGNSMSANPKELTDEEIFHFLKDLL
ncbi:MAG: iron-containing alcohol dehydrogenase [Planctomycetia bacterium]|nr:iron-containing alcohol dehydrogenase [Planctomycetia bacterium]